MSNKQPYIPFYVGDWLSDPNVSMLSPMSRGIWIDLLCAMHKNNRSGEIAGLIEQLSRVTRCSIDEFKIAINELENTKTADVTNCNGNITIINRRMKKESKERNNTRERVKKHRVKLESDNKCNSNVQESNAFYEDESEIAIKTEIENKIGSDEEIKILVTEFYNYQNAMFSDLVKINDKKINEGIKIISKLIRIDSFKIEKIKDVLNFIVHDEFWSKQVLSLSGLRRRMPNGNAKFVNALLKMKAGTGESRVSEYNKAQLDEFEKEYKEHEVE